MQEGSLTSKFDFLRSIPNLIILGLLISGALVLAWVGQITWKDLTFWNKDLGSIFFGSRTGEPISLEIGMLLVYYLFIGLSLVAAGLVLFLRNRISIIDIQQPIGIQAQKNVKKNDVVTENKTITTIKNNSKDINGVMNEERFFSGCLHHFGYLSSRPKDSPIPQECIICQRLGDCMVATVYVKKAS